MTILVVGDERNLQECQQKFGSEFSYQHIFERTQVGDFLKDEFVVFDFQDQDKTISIYSHHSGVVFLNYSKSTLTKSENTRTTFFGFCGLPTFLNREILEVCTTNEADLKILKDVCRALKTEFAAVKNQVGLITPRVIGMIINEAYFAAEENIASRQDIDLAMKLGTNYPFGPFEWCQKIGVKNVFELLDAVYNSTSDERYKVCNLLKSEAIG